jgi:hypothetical protein
LRGFTRLKGSREDLARLHQNIIFIFGFFGIFWDFLGFFGFIWDLFGIYLGLFGIIWEYLLEFPRH